MTDRERILERIRQGLGSKALLPSTEERPGSSVMPRRSSTQSAGASTPNLSRRFQEEAELQSVAVHEAADPAEAGRLLAGILDHLSAKQVMTWNDPILERSGVRRLLLEKEIEDSTAPAGDSNHMPNRTEYKALAARAEVGITAADWALADTGTLVLLSAPERGRAASLLPPAHVALLPASRILADLGELMKRLPAGPDEALARESSVTLITGTSKTADIELTLVRGVHGPGEVHVIVIQDDGS